MTVLIEVECILNSRPLTYLYPDDLDEPLIPSHLISGRRMLSLPNATRSGTYNSSSVVTATSRARYLQRFMHHFLNRWRREYIPALNETNKSKLDSAGQTARESMIRQGEQTCALLLEERAYFCGVRYNACFP